MRSNIASGKRDQSIPSTDPCDVFWTNHRDSKTEANTAKMGYRPNYIDLGGELRSSQSETIGQFGDDASGQLYTVTINQCLSRVADFDYPHTRQYFAMRHYGTALVHPHPAPAAAAAAAD